MTKPITPIAYHLEKPLTIATLRPYDRVRPLIDKLVGKFTPACTRIEIAGSCRRHAARVGAIDLVAQPRFDRPVLGTTPGARWGWSALDHLLQDWDSRGFIDITNGNREHGKARTWVQFLLVSNTPLAYTVNLFLQPDACTWGVNMLTHTGSEAFVQRMFTSQGVGGLMPDGLRVESGLVWRGRELVSTPNERDVFDLWGMDYVAPEAREK